MNAKGTGVIAFTFCIALLMAIMPLPEWARPFRPQWVSLTLIYWCIALPHRVGVGTGFVVGIVMDVLTGTLMGQHALGLSLIAFLAVQTHARVRVFPLWQQSVAILLLLVLEHLLSLWVMGASGKTPPGLVYWVIPLIGALLWPWVFVTLRDIRRRFKIA